MSLILSISNQLVKLTRIELSRLTDEQGLNPGVQPVVTNSTQVSWQFQVVRLTGRLWAPYDNGDWVVMAVEAYSRYTMMKVYSLKPSWPEVATDFRKLWLDHMISWMHVGGFIRGKQVDHFVEQFDRFFQPEQVTAFRNYDPSIGGHIADNQQWLSAFLKDESPRYFDDENAWDLCAHLNQLSRRSKGLRGKKHEFMPQERFLDDSLYRFAAGLCDVPIPACRPGDFPNPHRAATSLSLVR